MRLVALRPEWFASPGRAGMGVTFDCPCCIGKPNAVRLALAFSVPLDGGAPLPLGKMSVLWEALNPKSDPQVPAIVPPGVHWAHSGITFETLSLMPSVDASAAGHWHGFITNGDAK